jgi:hypothetical protein
MEDPVVISLLEEIRNGVDGLPARLRSLVSRDTINRAERAEPQGGGAAGAPESPAPRGGAWDWPTPESLARLSAGMAATRWQMAASRRLQALFTRQPPPPPEAPAPAEGAAARPEAPAPLAARSGKPTQLAPRGRLTQLAPPRARPFALPRAPGPRTPRRAPALPPPPAPPAAERLRRATVLGGVHNATGQQMPAGHGIDWRFAPARRFKERAERLLRVAKVRHFGRSPSGGTRTHLATGKPWKGAVRLDLERSRQWWRGISEALESAGIPAAQQRTVRGAFADAAGAGGQGPDQLGPLIRELIEALKRHREALDKLAREEGPAQTEDAERADAGAPGTEDARRHRGDGAVSTADIDRLIDALGARPEGANRGGPDGPHIPPEHVPSGQSGSGWMGDIAGAIAPFLEML